MPNINGYSGQYLEWLKYKIKAETEDHKDHSLLIKDMYNTPFNVIIKDDAMRAQKTKELFDDFCSDEGIYGSKLLYAGLPSVLEVLISLAVLTEGILHDGEYGDRTANWFWDMVGNLGLLEYTDDHYDPNVVKDILNRFTNREYCKNGKGSIARTRRRTADFSKIDLFRQINVFITEQEDL